MSSTERKITYSVDGCFNQDCGKPCFRYITHETHEIAVRIEIGYFDYLIFHALNALKPARNRVFKTAF